MAAPIKIDSEEAYNDLLRQLLESQTGESSVEAAVPQLKFENWPVLQVHVQGKDLHGTIPTSVMSFFINMQRAVNRAYALEVHNSTNARLTADEREKLQFHIKINPGSSLFEIHVCDTLNKIIELMDGKLEGHHAVGLALIWAGLFLGSAFIDHLNRKLEAKQRKELSGAQHEQLEMIHKIIKTVLKKPKVHEQNIETIQNSILRIIAAGEKGETSGIEMRSQRAHALVRAPRRMVKEVRLDGKYRIIKVDTREAGEYRLLLRSAGGKKLWAVTRNINSKPKIKKALQEGEWNRQLLQMTIQARAFYNKSGKLEEYRDTVILNAKAAPSPVASKD